MSMGLIDTTAWRRRGYMPASEIARALGCWPITVHRHMDRGNIPFELEGRYRFAKVDDVVRWVRDLYSDEAIAAEKVKAIKVAARGTK